MTKRWRAVVTAEKVRYVLYEVPDALEVPTVDQLPPPEEAEIPPYMRGKRHETLDEVKARIIAAGGPEAIEEATGN